MFFLCADKANQIQNLIKRNGKGNGKIVVPFSQEKK